MDNNNLPNNRLPENLSRNSHQYVDNRPNERVISRRPAISSYFSTVGIVLGVVVLFLVAVSVFRISAGKQIPTFYSFLNMLSECPQMPLYMVISTDMGDWGFLNFIRDAFASGYNVFNFFISNMINIFLYFSYFVRWLFV